MVSDGLVRMALEATSYHPIPSSNISQTMTCSFLSTSFHSTLPGHPSKCTISPQTHSFSPCDSLFPSLYLCHPPPSTGFLSFLHRRPKTSQPFSFFFPPPRHHRVGCFPGPLRTSLTQSCVFQMAATTASDVADGPVLSVINKRLRALRKKLNRIIQMEESIAQGKTINKEQEEVLRSKPGVVALIDEFEKLRQPLSSAVSEEVNLALQNHQISVSTQTLDEPREKTDEPEGKVQDFSHPVVEDLLNLLYFGSLFDVETQNDFTSTMLTRIHERGCCLSYDYVTDDATDLLSEKDLDLISMLRGLLISRPADSSLSHKNALQRCIDHAKLWLAKADQPIEPNADVTYAKLRERLNKIMSSEYFTTTPEMKAPVEVVAAAGNYATFEVPVHGAVIPTSVPVEVEVEGSISQSQEQDEAIANYQVHETREDQSYPAEELQRDRVELENLGEVASAEQEQVAPQADVEHNERDVEAKGQQYLPRKYQNYRGGRGGGRKGYSNGRGGVQGGGRGSGYQNGRNQYYDQPGNYYPRNYYNNRGRGGGGRGSGHSYNNHGSGGLVNHASADGVRS